MKHLLPAHPGEGAGERLCHQGLAREAAAPASGTPRGGGSRQADRFLRPVSQTGGARHPIPTLRTPSPAFHHSAPIPRPPRALPAARLAAHPQGLGVGGRGRAGRVPAPRGGEDRGSEGAAPRLSGPPGAGRPPGRDASPRRARAGVARGRPRGGTSSQWRWYSSMVAPILPRGGATGGSNSAAAQWPPGRPRPRLCTGAVPTKAPPLCRSGATLSGAWAPFCAMGGVCPLPPTFLETSVGWWSAGDCDSVGQMGWPSVSLDSAVLVECPLLCLCARILSSSSSQ